MARKNTGKNPSSRPTPQTPAGKCTSFFCSETAVKDGYCANCWTAIFG